MRTKRYLQNHVAYQRTRMILRNPLASPVRGARQNGHAPSRAFGWAPKAIQEPFTQVHTVTPIPPRIIKPWATSRSR